MTFLVAEDVDRADLLGRIGHDGLQNPPQVLGERLRRGLVEQVGAVLEHAVDGVADLDEVEREVELRRLRAERHGPRLDAGEGETAVGAGDVHDHGLEQRMSGERSGRVEDLDEPFERDILVVERGEVGVAYAGEQVGERGVAGGVGAQDERVEEEADQVLQRLVAAAGDRAAEGDVGAGAEPGEEDGDGGLDEHEHADVVGLRELAQPLREVVVEGEVDGSAAIAGLERSGPVVRETELLGQVLQRALPERELPCRQAVVVVLVA